MKLKTVIILLFVIFIVLYLNNQGVKSNKEHMTSTTSNVPSISDIDVEALQNLASMYNDGVLTASALNITGAIDTESLNVSGETDTSSLKVSGATDTSSLKVSGETDTSSLKVSGSTDTSSLKVSGAIDTASLKASGTIDAYNLNLTSGAVANYFALKKDASANHDNDDFHDGAFYRSNGDLWISADDRTYVRDNSTGGHLKIQDGWTNRNG